MIRWLTKIAEHSEIAWVAAIALALVQAYQWVDARLYQRYRDRLADAADWSAEQRAVIERLQADADSARDEAAHARSEAKEANARAEKLEERAKAAEEHAAWCEERLLELTTRLDEDSDVDWSPTDV